MSRTLLILLGLKDESCYSIAAAGFLDLVIKVKNFEEHHYEDYEKLYHDFIQLYQDLHRLRGTKYLVPLRGGRYLPTSMVDKIERLIERLENANESKIQKIKSWEKEQRRA